MLNKKGLLGMALTDVVFIYAIVFLLVIAGVMFWMGRATIGGLEEGAVKGQYKASADLFLVNYLRSPVALESGKVIEVSDLIGDILLVEDKAPKRKILEMKTEELFEELRNNGKEACFRIIFGKEEDSSDGRSIGYCYGTESGELTKGKMILPLIDGSVAELNYEVLI